MGVLGQVTAWKDNEVNEVNEVVIEVRPYKIELRRSQIPDTARNPQKREDCSVVAPKGTAFSW